ncbi:hypothetical protein CEUSTIGMA_g4212.t1 [Chlamydomonas eustigma]|uniref:Uncharacterized protein n=1 Tax=Chlamydomonas eustigma TaxID=1157962 RepID=A0A250X137_9CHLO|nr:hypothetical protein CEUSTIGMA_g4212.t1 [Chlamydomonas eustigma]|eukprot:GAX76765.1 hypothetical protein CEUSTIGMA_g4212.t1 [Chlamydomonas eustigma]
MAPGKPFPSASRLIDERFKQNAMEIHDRKIERASAVVDCSEPSYMHRLDYNPKKAESESERQFEIDAENLRMYERLKKIEDFDSTQVLRASTIRSSMNSTPGMFHSDVGGSRGGSQSGSITGGHTQMVSDRTNDGEVDFESVRGSQGILGRSVRGSSTSGSTVRFPQSMSVMGPQPWSGQLIRNRTPSLPGIQPPAEEKLILPPLHRRPSPGRPNPVTAVSAEGSTIFRRPNPVRGTVSTSCDCSPTYRRSSIGAGSSTMAGPRTGEEDAGASPPPKPPRRPPQKMSSSSLITQNPMNAVLSPEPAGLEQKFAAEDTFTVFSRTSKGRSSSGGLSVESSISSFPQPPLLRSSRGPSPLRASSRGPSPIRRSTNLFGEQSFSQASFTSVHDHEARKEVLKHVYLSGAHVEDKGGLLVASRRSFPYGALPNDTNHGMTFKGNEADSDSAATAFRKGGVVGMPNRGSSGSCKRYQDSGEDDF